jgi:hypothetical protein
MNQQLPQDIQEAWTDEDMKAAFKAGIEGEYNCDPGMWLTIFKRTASKQSPLPDKDLLEDGWISVKDRLPEYRPGWSNSKDVSVCFCDEAGFYTVSMGSFSYLKNEWHEYVYNGKRIITHWRPLPMPPFNQPNK